jgi:hypothetical protein
VSRSRRRSVQLMVRRISSLLYSYDPAGFGSSVDAPLDEYDSHAGRVISRVAGGSHVVEILRELFPSADGRVQELLAEEIERLLSDFDHVFAQPDSEAKTLATIRKAEMVADEGQRDA